MCEKHLFELKHNGDTVKVFTGSGTSDVFYRKNGGASRSAGMYYKADRGIFVATSGKSLTWNEAESRVRGML